MKTVLHTLGALLLVPATLLAQGTLIITNEVVRLPRPVPQPPQTTYHLETLEMNSKVMGQIADVQVSQTFVNSGKRTIEAQLVFPLPYDGAIDKMTLMVNGTELEAKLLSADEAKARYQSIVRANKDPALLEWIGTGMFQTSVFPIPPGEKRTVTLHYTQLLRKDHGLTDFLYPLRTAKFTSRPLSKLSMRVVIEAPADIKNIYSPSHAVDIDRSGERHAVVTFEQQNVVPSEDFRLLFDTKEGKIGATVLTYRPDKSEEGYFLLLASPRVKSGDGEPQAKTISFVVDKSGSMSGEKIEQAREAAKFVLNNLRKGDLFNIISYDSSVQAFRPELESFTSESRASGLAYVDGLYAGGGTNIHDALLRSFQDLQDKKRPNYILFLTDGKPTSGVTGESLIAKAISEANGIKARLMAFGVGYDVNSRLLDRLSRENHGLSEYVRPNEDIEEAVARVYRRISSPVLTNVSLDIEFDDGKSKSTISRVYPAGTFDLFEGEQLVVVGRYKGSGAASIKLTGTLDGTTQSYDFTGEFDKKSRDDTNAFVAKLWATRRIGELIDELDLHGKNDELVEELVALSTKYGILTPYTSFLADETVAPELASADNRMRAGVALQQLDAQSGQAAFEQRGLKQQFKNAAQAPTAPASADRISTGAPGGALPPTPGGAGGGAPATTQPATAIHESTVRQAKGNTLYKRGQLVVTPETASLDLEKDKDKYQVVERYSDEYFKLVDDNTASENELLAKQGANEQLLVQLRGQNYLIK